MGKYLFDRVGRSRSEYDYKGRACSTPETAREMAELIALDLSIEPEGHWLGWTVEVRDALGQMFFSIPVHHAELHLA